VVMEQAPTLPITVSIAKGLEPETRKRMSEVYAEEVGHGNVVAVSGPSLAPEIASGAPTAVMAASANLDTASLVASCLRGESFEVTETDDVLGVEYCSVAKNVAAIGMGIVDGLAKVRGSEFRNAKAALFAQAARELVDLVTALGGRAETVYGLAGVGDILVTSLGGRNRLYGEMIGEGVAPDEALADLTGRGLTVEGVESARDVRELTGGLGLKLPLHAQVEMILFDGAPAVSVLECLKG
jgi:glycerol-3-phosphate dehydrogenase (NAD(P)+)